MSRSTSCFGGSVSSNTVTDAAQAGILVTSDNPGLYVEKNSVLRAGVGITVSNTPGATVMIEPGPAAAMAAVIV